MGAHRQALAHAPATSRKYALRLRIMKSQMKMIATPITNTVSVSNAPFGITRSYTIIEKPEVASAKRFVKSAARATWR